MPDFSKYSTDMPYVRPELPNQGLSLLAKPLIDYKNTFPPTSNKPQSLAYNPNAGEKNPFTNLGIVPLGGGAVTDYNTAKRYDDENLLFNPYRDNEDIYAQDQSFWSSVARGMGRLALTTGTKLGTAAGFITGLVGIDNQYQDYGGAWDFNAWIAGAGDNALAQSFQKAEDWVKQDLLPIYQEAADRDKGFFHRLATDLNMWTEDGTDLAAFILSAYVPGAAIGRLGLGTKFLTRAAAAKGLTYADEAAALSAEGLSGGVESAEALSQGLTTAPGALEAAVPTLVKNPYTAANALPRVFALADNAKIARGIDVGITTFLNTGAESMVEGNDVKNQLLDRLGNEKDAFGNAKYTKEQVRLMAAEGAADTFKMNMAALAISNLWEANLFFKKLPAKGSEFTNKLNTKGVWSDVTLQKKALGRRIWGANKDIVKGVGAEGFWEENIQLAIQRLNEQDENFSLDFSDKLANLTEQYVTQTVEAFKGNDVEASTSIGLGGLIGGLTGKIAGSNEAKRLRGNISNLNSAVSMFKTYGNIYKTDDQGNIELDANGSPVKDETKIKSYVASMNKIVGLQETARNMEARGVNELSRIYKDEIFTRYAKAHFDNGLGDVIFQKLNDIKNISKEDMILLGFDPNSKDSTIQAQVEAAKQKAQKLEEIYNNIQRNYLPNKNRKKFSEITDKMFYMSARIDSLNDMLKDTKTNYENVKQNSDAYNESFNRETDRVVDDYNVLFQKQQATKRYFDMGIYENDSEFVERKTEMTKAQEDLDNYVKDNKDTLTKLKTDSRGRYMYEVENKNLLPSAKEMERLQIIQAEAELGIYNSTQILSRLADIKFGERYYDEKFKPALQKETDKILAEQTRQQELKDELDQKNLAKTMGVKVPDVELNEDEVDGFYEDVVNKGVVSEDKEKVVSHIASKLSKGKPLTEKEEAIRRTVKTEVDEKLKEKKDSSNLNDLNDEYQELQREKEALEAMDNKTDEQEDRLNEIYNELEALEAVTKEKFDELDNELTVANSNNIKEVDKEDFKNILNKIDKNRSRVKKYDDRYEIDGVPYRKVTEVIGDVISEEDREKRQNAIIAGYTIDEIVKEFFSNGLGLSPEFKASISSKISDEALASVIKDLENVRNELKKKGVEIIDSNVFVFDEEQKIAGEIDILAVDKNGDFKIYEIQARKSNVYAQYGIRGRGLTIREIDQQRLTAYRNLFANQYGAIPDEISIMFPFQVKYDKESSSGYIQKAKRKDTIRFTPSRTVEVKRKFFQPIRTGSKFDNFDILRIFGSSFIPTEEGREKMRFILRNVTIEDIKKKIVLVVKKPPVEFQEKYNQQTALLNGEKTTHTLKKYPGMDNLYALSGNMEMAIMYEGTLMGYMPPRQKLAYKDDKGNFQVLDQNTDEATYVSVTGNSASTYPEFKRLSKFYEVRYNEIINNFENSGKDSLTLTNAELQKLFDVNMSFGELDKVPIGKERPTVNSLVIPGVRVGTKSVATIVNIDQNDSIKVIMDKTKKTKSTITKHQQIDRWANNNISEIIKAVSNADGKRVTDFVSIIELPDGTYRVISVRKKGETDIDTSQDFITDVGAKFTASTSKNVFKNENVLLVPNYTEEVTNFDLKEKEVLDKIYNEEDLKAAENKGVKPAPIAALSTEDTIKEFLIKLSPEDKSKINRNFAAYEMTDSELIIEMTDDYNSGEWASITEYLENLKNCK